MIILSGLGNPGKEYDGTRHNIGFDLINCLHKHYNFPEFRKKFDGLFSKSEILGQEVVMFKPEKFMNLSGKPIRAISQFFKVNCKRNLYVLHDDLDLSFLKIRIKEAGGHGGHNGIKDIINNIGNEFHRVKIGIKNNPLIENKISSSDFVLSKFSSSEKKKIIEFKKKIQEHFYLILNRNFSLFINNLNI